MTDHVSDERLQDYVDGRLDPKDGAAVEAHVGECDACATELAELRALLARIAALPGEIQPPHDLLPELHARLERRPALGSRSLHSLRYPLAAAAALLVISTALLTRAITRVPSQDRTAAATVADSDTGPQRARAGARGAAEPVALPPHLAAQVARYGDAIDELQRTLAHQRADLSPQTIDVLERSLRVIDAALAESRDALTRDPQNPVLERMILSTYEQKLQLLRRAAEATTS